ncbi:ATP-binding protein [Clostridium ganghwense]|uniref:histidine kinase n=1 Tax=Clostridium ganghwense TaxID=312089 RepID=A0ABT4CT98_9CLOT|nr:ATP-binding protein [Clostridium ganghwense]MCY6371174.1 ATP-binding protein [Clostridium ganghwense]
MESITFYLILLFLYATLALIFISFNIVHPKKYINFMSISHILGIITVVFTLFGEVNNKNNLMTNIAVFFFLSSNFLAYATIESFLKRKISKYHLYGAISLVIIDLLALNFICPISVFIHKIFLMFIYIYLGMNILKCKNKTFSIHFLAITTIIFPLVQMVFGFSWLFIARKDYYIDIVAYILHTVTLSFSIILITIEETHRKFDSHVNLLQEEVKSNQKLLQDAYELDKLKTEFIANISHELRTPINIIFSSIQIFEINLPEKCAENQKLKNYLKTMRQNCYRLIKLINNLIDMSKIEAGFMQLNLYNYDIVKLIEDITLSIVPYAEEKCIQIEFDTEFEEKVIACDSEKMERIMLNLLSNAVKFTRESGEIKVNICEKDGQILISIKDNGIGIPENMQKSIYNRFTQVSETFVRENEGSGIGLSLVKSFVEMHGGKIMLESEIDKGCKFTIVLPLKVLDDHTRDNVSLNEINMKKIEIEFSDVNV